MSRATGSHWEGVAQKYLQQRGVQTLLRGYNCRLGELDLVCNDGDWLVIVEVRARRSNRFASAAESVGPGKRRRLVQAARHLMMKHPEWALRPIRFDVVAIEHIRSRTPKINWIRHAFDTDA